MVARKFPVRGASQARISFDIDLPGGAELLIEHLDGETLLSRELRPLPEDANQVDVKTHPSASRLACAILLGGEMLEGPRIGVECGDTIEPVGRHFIVIGAMKAGTTTLFRALERHPELCRTWAEGPGPSTAKEINYFRKLYQNGDTPLHYDWRFPYDCAKHAWTLDVSPNYAKLPGSREVPRRIASLGARTKIAYILRHPVDRVESHLAHASREGVEVRNLRHAIRISRYSSHLDVYAAQVSLDDILLLDFEQLRRDPASLMATICRFLGIDQVIPPVHVHNKRSVRLKLTAAQRKEITDAVRPDVERLIETYNFEPAEHWLRGRRSWWRRA